MIRPGIGVQTATRDQGPKVGMSTISDRGTGPRRTLSSVERSLCSPEEIVDGTSQVNGVNHPSWDVADISGCFESEYVPSYRPSTGTSRPTSGAFLH
jgi:hypothetical protein